MQKHFFNRPAAQGDQGRKGTGSHMLSRRPLSARGQRARVLRGRGLQIREMREKYESRQRRVEDGPGEASREIIRVLNA